MEAFILWVLMVGGSGVGFGPQPAIATAEYSSLDACERAELQLKQDFGHRIKTSCTSKN